MNAVRSRDGRHPGDRHRHWRAAAPYLTVAAGSMLGGTARWLISALLHPSTVTAFPWGTLAANVSGSFLIGLYAGLSAPEGRLLASPRQRLFVMAGFLGGYTTFSIFSLETVRLVEAGRLELAALNTGTSVIGWLAAVWAGYALATYLNRLPRSRDAR